MRKTEICTPYYYYYYFFTIIQILTILMFRNLTKCLYVCISVICTIWYNFQNSYIFQGFYRHFEIIEFCFLGTYWNTFQAWPKS